MPTRFEHTFATCAAAWPGVIVEPSVFQAWLAARGAEDAEPERAAELYLACACVQGDAQAIRTFESRFFRSAAAVVKADAPGAMRDELLQHLRQRLFLGTEETGPKLAEYGGRGGLARWVRAVAARLALNLRRDRKDERFDELGEDELMGAPIGAEDPELAHIKGLYRQEFKQAFSEALASLEPELQNFLRLYYLDGLELSQLASLYRFSVPTMSRRLAKAREAALEATRSVLQRRLTVSADELASIMRLIQSRLTMR